VAIDRDQVTGHVALHHPTQDPACPVAQAAAGVGDFRLVALARLFADVDRRGAHLGDRLLENATGAAHREGRRPFLNVVTHLTRAIALYQRHGWDDLGPLSIPFPDGTSLDVLVFLGPPPP
jgi:GNAT superfamily N-acetyltransferase